VSGSGKFVVEVRVSVAGTSVGVEVLAIAVWVGNAAVTVAGTDVGGGVIVCPLLQAPIERSKKLIRILLMN
jgi:hypothetical protein